MSLLAGSVGLAGAPAEAVGGEVLLVCPEMTDSVVRLYSAYFLRGPDAEGIDFWTKSYSEGGWTLAEISEHFSVSTEFQALYGELSNLEFVNLIYQNILGRAGEAEGVNFWTGRLDQGLEDRGAVMLKFSEGPEYVTKSGTVPPLAGYYQWYPEGTVWACGNSSGILPIAQLPGPSYVDGIAWNFNQTLSENFIIWTLNPQQDLNSLVVNEIVPAGQLYYFWNDVTDTSRFDTDTAFIDVQAIDADRTDFFWSVVFYPASIGTARGGWDDAGLETR